MDTLQLICIAAIGIGIINILSENSNAQHFYRLSYQEPTPFDSQPIILVSTANTNSNSTIAKVGVTDSELDILRSINKTDSEILAKIDELANDRTGDIIGIISSYLSVISFLIAVATFILAFFMALEFDGKLTDAMKRYYRLITFGLILPSVYMIGYGIYLIITELNSIPYLISLTLTAVPISILLHLMTKKLR